LGVLSAACLSAIVKAMTVFYSLSGVSVFVPVLGGLYSRRAGQTEALAAIAAGIVVLLVVRFGVAGRYPWLDPALSGLIASGVAFVVVMVFNRKASLVL